MISARDVLVVGVSDGSGELMATAKRTKKNTFTQNEINKILKWPDLLV